LKRRMVIVEPVRISAKNLGALALPDLCPRCFWIKMHVQDKLPYQIFPGIFSSIDSYGKRLIHGWFDRHRTPPPWLASLGDIAGYVNPPHYSKFFVLDSETSVILSGTPDGILVLRDQSNLIVDYKTARFTEHQDSLFPLYEVQLNAYAYIGERCGLSPVSGLALIYTEPVTDQESADKDTNLTDGGFVMEFSSHILPVTLRAERIPSLLRMVRSIYDLERPPAPSPSCKDCVLLDRLISVASR
jgi:hypothetical protein